MAYVRGVPNSDPSDLKTRLVHIQYIHFRYQIHGSSVDKRCVTAPGSSFHFYLNFPQYTYNDISDTTTAILGGTPVQCTSSGVAQSLGSYFNASGNTTSSTPTGNKPTILPLELSLPWRYFFTYKASCTKKGY